MLLLATIRYRQFSYTVYIFYSLFTIRNLFNMASIRMYVCMYVCNFIDSSQGCFFLKESLLLDTLHFYRYTLINRCQPVPVRFPGPELVAPHLELAWDEHL